MRIGIDIDEVLNSQYNFCIEYGTKFCNEIGKYKRVYSWYDIYSKISSIK